MVSIDVRTVLDDEESGLEQILFITVIINGVKKVGSTCFIISIWGKLAILNNSHYSQFSFEDGAWTEEDVDFQVIDDFYNKASNLRKLCGNFSTSMLCRIA